MTYKKHTKTKKVHSKSLGGACCSEKPEGWEFELPKSTQILSSKAQLAGPYMWWLPHMLSDWGKRVRDKGLTPMWIYKPERNDSPYKIRFLAVPKSWENLSLREVKRRCHRYHRLKGKI